MLGSVTECLERAKQGESYAQLQLFERYRFALAGLARGRLTGDAARVADADDVVSGAFYDFLVGAVAGRFRKLNDRRDLWQILLTLTQRRVVNQRRYATAQKRTSQRLKQACLASPEVAECELDQRTFFEEQLVDESPSPALAAQLQEEFLVRLEQLDGDKLRSVAISKLAGFSNQEIAAEMDCSLRSVERKLALIRRRWKASGKGR